MAMDKVQAVSALNNYKRLSFSMVWADGDDQISDFVRTTHSSSVLLTREILNRG